MLAAELGADVPNVQHPKWMAEASRSTAPLADGGLV
jgi:hypothetical protein